MPEIRYVYVYENGVLVSQESYTVDDDQLADEKVVSDLQSLALVDIDGAWGPVKVRQILQLVVKRLRQRRLLE